MRSGIGIVGIGSAPLWLTRAAYCKKGSLRKRKVLISIFQRGGADGLNMVVPFGEKAYYESRPTIAVPPPGSRANSTLDLDGFFGLHPNLGDLKAIFLERRLAIVHAVGSPDRTRSHFDAQDYMESGTPGVKSTADGWLNRALSIDAPSDKSPVRAVSITGPILPRMLSGGNSAIALSGTPNEFRIKEDHLAKVLPDVYLNSADHLLNATATEAIRASRVIQSVLTAPYVPANGAKYPEGRFSESMQQIARLIKSDVGLEVAFTDTGGWDTHIHQIGATVSDGLMARLLIEFAATLAAFDRDMGDLMEDVVLVTMSEFGRTLKENVSRGTDHGHGGVMFVMGGNVRGGKVYGEWPGLAPEQLYGGRDLHVTSDFRDVLFELVVHQLGQAQSSDVFPGFAKSKNLGILI